MEKLGLQSSEQNSESWVEGMKFCEEHDGWERLQYMGNCRGVRVSNVQISFKMPPLYGTLNLYAKIDIVDDLEDNTQVQFRT